MADQDAGLGGLRDVARALNADELDARMERLGAELERDTDELIGHVNRLQESVRELKSGTVTRINAEPRANLEPTEDELSYLIEIIPDDDLKDRAEAQSIYLKMAQALTLESRPGGRFHGDGAA